MTIFILIFLLLLVIYSLLIDYYRRAWNAIPEPESARIAGVKATIVIAARNEEENIPVLLLCLEAQDYPKELFEVIIVDDHSTDNTWHLLSSHHKSINLHAMQLSPGNTGKKKAIELAVNAASGKLIVQTDADCTMSAEWLRSVAAFYEQTGAKFIAAPVLIRGGNSLRHVFESLDFLTLQTITGASVYKRFHTMCNGANLAFEKSAFQEVNGFAGIDQIPSGDDMLLMHKIYSAYPDKVFYLKQRAAIVSTMPQPSWKHLFHQRVRWASKAVHYKDRRIFYVLLITYLINAGFLALAVATIIKVYWLPFLILFISAKILIEFPFVNRGAQFFGERRLMKWFPLIQPLHIAYVVIAGWLGRFGSYEWKSRITKNNTTGNLAKQ